MEKILSNSLRFLSNLGIFCLQVCIIVVSFPFRKQKYVTLWKFIKSVTLTTLKFLFGFYNKYSVFGFFAVIGFLCGAVYEFLMPVIGADIETRIIVAFIIGLPFFGAFSFLLLFATVGTGIYDE